MALEDAKLKTILTAVQAKMVEQKYTKERGKSEYCVLEQEAKEAQLVEAGRPSGGFLGEKD